MQIYSRSVDKIGEEIESTTQKHNKNQLQKVLPEIVKCSAPSNVTNFSDNGTFILVRSWIFVLR